MTDTINHQSFDSTATATDDSIDMAKLQSELQYAVIQLQQRYMLLSSKWCNELLIDIANNESDNNISDTSVQINIPCNNILMGLNYMYCHEYQRCIWTLRNKSILNHSHPMNSTNYNIHAHSTYLRLYSTYLAYQQQNQYNTNANNMAANNSGRSASNHNNELQLLLNELYDSIINYTAVYNKNADRSDSNHTDTIHIDIGCMWYLYALVCKELSNNSTLIESNSTTTYITYSRISCIMSINMYVYNWSAWKLLATLCTSNEIMLQCCINGIDCSNVKLPIPPSYHNTMNTENDHPNQPIQNNVVVLNDHFLRQFWLADVLLELHDSDTTNNINDTTDQLTSNSIITTLAGTFPNSTYLLQQSAVAYYYQRNFELSQQLFDQLREIDPYRIDCLDIYSNILYVKELYAALSYLAHFVNKYYKYHSITCVIIGNYYSLNHNHTTAIQYFKRAIQLDCTYIAAYTLMGHEYVELRNTSAAIEAYRYAIKINSKDFRAWYGLGQVYEILQLHTYALYYYRHTVTLRPFDSRMWCALAQSYTNINMDDNAIKCYLRADGNNDKEGVAVYKLAKLLRKRNDHTTAAYYYKKVLLYQNQQYNRIHQINTDNNENNTDTNELYSELINSDTLLNEQSIDAMQYLAEYTKSQAIQYSNELNYTAANQQYMIAELYCNRLLDCGGNVKDIAKALLMEIRQLKSYHQQQSTNTSFNKKSNQ